MIRLSAPWLPGRSFRESTSPRSQCQLIQKVANKKNRIFARNSLLAGTWCQEGPSGRVWLPGGCLPAAGRQPPGCQEACVSASWLPKGCLPAARRQPPGSRTLPGGPSWHQRACQEAPPGQNGLFAIFVFPIILNVGISYFAVFPKQCIESYH